MEKTMKKVGGIVFFLYALIFMHAQTPYVRTYGMSGFTNEGVDIVALPDITYIIAGNRVAPSGYSWAWIFKTDSLGKILWEKYVDEYDLSTVNELRKTQDGNILAIGTALKNNSYFGYVYKFTPTGQILWKYANISNEWNQGVSVCAGKNNYVYATFTSLGTDSLDQDVVFKILDNTTGQEIGSKRVSWHGEQEPTFIDTLSDNTLGCTIVQKDSNGYSSYFIQLSENLDSIFAYHVGNDTIQVYLNGFVIDTLNVINFYGFHQKWNMTETRFLKGKLDLNLGIPFFIFYNDFAYTMNDGVIDKTTNNVYLVGNTTNNFGFGNWDVALFVDTVGGGRSGYYGAIARDWGNAVDLSPDNAVVLLGSTENYFNAVRSILFIKLHKTKLSYNDQNYQHYTPIGNFMASSFTPLVFPNPSTGALFFQAEEEGILFCYNSFGQKIFSQHIFQNLEQIDLTALPNGYYFFVFQTSQKVAHFSVLLQR
jgi:hypothetical protein